MLKKYLIYGSLFLLGLAILPVLASASLDMEAEVPVSERWRQAEGLLSSLEADTDQAGTGEPIEVKLTLRGYGNKVLANREVEIRIRPNDTPDVFTTIQGTTDADGVYVATISSLDPQVVQIGAADISQLPEIALLEGETLYFKGWRQSKAEDGTDGVVDIGGSFNVLWQNLRTQFHQWFSKNE